MVFEKFVKNVITLIVLPFIVLSYLYKCFMDSYIDNRYD
jgi:hypothetical protein